MTSVDTERRARFDVLVRSTYAPLRRYLARRADPADVDDVLADTLLVMWRRIDDVPDDAALPWCYGTARRCLANARRAERRRLGLLRRIAAQSDPRNDPGSGAEAYAASELPLAEALAALAAHDREILRLWAWEQLEPREMAVVLDITANAASIRLHRATRRLRRQLGITDHDAGQDATSGGGKDGAVPGHKGPRQDGPREDTEAPR